MAKQSASRSEHVMLLGVWKASGSRKEPPGHMLRHSLTSGTKPRNGTNSRICATTSGLMGFPERSKVDRREDDETAWARASALSSSMRLLLKVKAFSCDFPLSESARAMAPVR